MQGFLNLHKPAGFTSHDCVAKVRKLLQMKRVGHGGTLDPAATGVLPIALGRATRLLQFLRSDKAYRATIRFGITTTTDDLEGDRLSEHPVPWLNLEQVQAQLPQFLGVIQQVPPRYSAIQVGGKRLYELARAGKTVDVPVRTVEVYGLDVLDWRSGEFPELEVAIDCGAGTYIRSIARDLGDRLTTGATLAQLIRTHSSGFNLEDSLSLDALAAQVQAHTFQPIAPATALQHLPSVVLSEAQTQRWSQGQRFLWQDITPGREPPSTAVGDAVVEPASPNESNLAVDQPVWQILGETGQFLGIGQVRWHHDKLMLVPKLVWA